ncbi:nucleolar protein 56 [Halorubrum aquaticum]|uniref:Nucleolar protein 56 n=1 Tax=Halorubrum aquaticum TaxID=387340 RepID=A0A1I3A2P3_9EURY|nr:nucleolar [Halorubrum aquaticum]SFH44146.1 nucleolar protein 56 [Halorubrum aquaticum]
MTNEPDAANAGWFSDLDPEDLDAAEAEILRGSAEEPEDWPRIAVESGYADSEEEYYDRLHEATIHATRQEVRERERADDQQLIHAVRAMDDCERVANELAERAAEWAGSRFDDAELGIAGAREIAAREPDGDLERRVVSLSARAVDLADERDELSATVDRVAPAVAPNLADMAGPELAARLIALAGGLEPLAKKPSGTVQVLGAEDALFAHLSGRAPSPKHGIIYTHEFVRGTRPEDRGSAARALAGKLALAARADHYSGEYREVLHEDLRERMATIRARAASEEVNANE